MPRKVSVTGLYRFGFNHEVGKIAAENRSCDEEKIKKPDCKVILPWFKNLTFRGSPSCTWFMASLV